MRSRMMVLLVGATIAVIALYGVPRAYFLADMVQEQQEHEAWGLARVLAAAISVQEDSGIPVTASFLADAISDDDLVRYEPLQGEPVAAGDIESSDSDITATEEVAGGAAVLVDPLDVDSIAAGIVEADARRDELRALGLARAQAYSWPAVADAAVGAWRELA